MDSRNPEAVYAAAVFCTSEYTQCKKCPLHDSDDCSKVFATEYKRLFEMKSDELLSYIDETQARKRAHVVVHGKSIPRAKWLMSLGIASDLYRSLVRQGYSNEQIEELYSMSKEDRIRKRTAKLVHGRYMTVREAAEELGVSFTRISTYTSSHRGDLELAYDHYKRQIEEGTMVPVGLGRSWRKGLTLNADRSGFIPVAEKDKKQRKKQTKSTDEIVSKIMEAIK